MNVFIVYQGEFDAFRPRGYMCEPHILLITANKDEAMEKMQETKLEMLECNNVKNIYGYDDCFEYDYNDFTYGKVGIIEYEYE